MCFCLARVIVIGTRDYLNSHYLIDSIMFVVVVCCFVFFKPVPERRIFCASFFSIFSFPS